MTKLSLLTIIFTSILPSRASTILPTKSTKTFRPVMSPQRQLLCVVDNPSQVLTDYELKHDVNMFGLSAPVIPSEVLCSYRCTAESNCTDFVYRYDIQQCQLYYFWPTTCLVQPRCIYYTVRTIWYNSFIADCIGFHEEFEIWLAWSKGAVHLSFFVLVFKCFTC